MMAVHSLYYCIVILNLLLTHFVPTSKLILRNDMLSHEEICALVRELDNLAPDLILRWLQSASTFHRKV
jgi:hypothetical protein